MSGSDWRCARPVTFLAAVLWTGCASTSFSNAEFSSLDTGVNLALEGELEAAEEAIAPILAKPSTPHAAMAARQTLGFIRFSQDRYAEAAVEYRLALDTGAAPPKTRPGLEQAYANSLAESGQCAQAVPLLEKWKPAAAEGKRFHMALVLCYAEQKRFDDAAALHQVVTSGLKGPTDGFTGLGRDIDQALMQGKVFPAGHFLDAFHASAALHERRLLDQAGALLKHKKYDAVELRLRPLLAEPATHSGATAHFLAGAARYEQKRFPDSVERFRKALQSGLLSDAGRTSTRGMLAFALARMGNCAEAIPILEERSAGGAKADRGAALTLLACYADEARFLQAQQAYRALRADTPRPSEVFLTIGASIDEALSQGRTYPNGYFVRALAGDSLTADSR